MTKTMSSACRASTPWRTPSLTSSCWSSSRWLAARAQALYGRAAATPFQDAWKPSWNMVNLRWQTIQPEMWIYLSSVGEEVEEEES